MDKTKDPRIRRYIIIAVVSVVLSVVMMFWARDVIREAIVLPLSYLIYVIGILVDYTPQIFFWIVLLLIGLRIAYLSISRKKKRTDDEYGDYYRASDDPYVTSGRVLFWANKVYQLRTGRGTYFTRTFHESLNRTLLQLLAYRYRITPHQVEERLKEGALELPQDVREYALKNLEVAEENDENTWEAMREWISTTWRKLLIRFGIAVPFFKELQKSMVPAPENTAAGVNGKKADLRLATNDALVRSVLTFMKEELEVPHDDSGL